MQKEHKPECNLLEGIWAITVKRDRQGALVFRIHVYWACQNCLLGRYDHCRLCKPRAVEQIEKNFWTPLFFCHLSLSLSLSLAFPPSYAYSAHWHFLPCSSRFTDTWGDILIAQAFAIKALQTTHAATDVAGSSPNFTTTAYRKPAISILCASFSSWAQRQARWVADPYVGL